MYTLMRRNAVFCIPSFLCSRGVEDGDCGPRDRCICLQLCTRNRNFCTSDYNVCSRACNYGTTSCKDDEIAADGGIFVSFTDLKAIRQRNSMCTGGCACRKQPVTV